MSIYNPGIPTGTVNLDVDYQNIQNNFSQLDTSFNVDHVTFSNTSLQNGYHKSIHFNPISTTATNGPNNIPPVVPVTTAGFGQLFNVETNDGPGAADTNLYFKTGLGNLIALTRSLLPSAGANGYTFIPGGFILQWGIYTAPALNWPTTEQTLTFLTQVPANVNFTAANYIVLTTFTGASGSSGSIGITSKSNTNFKWRFGGSSNSSFTGFQWIAIGI
jgi:hypothetical protein